MVDSVDNMCVRLPRRTHTGTRGARLYLQFEGSFHFTHVFFFFYFKTVSTSFVSTHFHFLLYVL